ncbi:type III secretion system chaperone [Shewanella sp. 202IG2-18]|uniref:type III secretion system chaperone n=1 Tax=Parashewanella hymeniacidonis TaxID=2807618 RepID=UPI0019607124|nr:type III secretion system chaperone [Parashewanella hymeniacidonis]MBM7072280.1 type III secretion system chaperone [Parashewanella hymeniacidonis]
MTFNELIQQFSRYYPQLTLETDEIGVVRFTLGNQFLIYLRNAFDEKTFYLYAQVGELPVTTDAKMQCYQQLLEANLFGDGVGLANLAIHQESNSIILTQTFNALHTNYSAFESAYISFLEYLTFWDEKLNTC